MTTTREQIIQDAGALFDAGLAIDITHFYGVGPSQETLKAFFDEDYQAGFDGVLPVENAYSRILVETAEAGNITKASYFTINTVTYYVYAMHLDDEGVMEIILTEDSAG